MVARCCRPEHREDLVGLLYPITSSAGLPLVIRDAAPTVRELLWAVGSLIRETVHVVGLESRRLALDLARVSRDTWRRTMELEKEKRR